MKKVEDDKKWYENGIDNIVRLIYSKEKRIERYVVALMIIGFFLRLRAALNLGVLADDMVFASQSAGIIGSGILSTHSNPPLFFYLTDLAYKLFGYTTLASRFWPLLCGTMLIGIIFLISKKLFNEKTGLLAAFFVTFSSFLVRMTFSEQSLVVFFLSFFAVYLGMNYLESKNKSWLYCSAVVFGIALLTKYNAPFIILSFILFALYYLKLEGIKVDKQLLKKFGIFVLILVVIFIPVIAFNYFIYQENGLVDVYFSRVIHVEKAQELYAGLAGQENSFFGNLFKISNYGNYKLLYSTDLIMLIFALFGLGLMFKKNKRLQIAFFFLFLIIPFVLQSAGAPLAKHFAFMPLLFAIPAGYALSRGFDKLGSKRGIKITILIVLAALMILNLGTVNGTPAHYNDKSATSELKSYTNNNVESNELIVFDDRIYTAQSFWLATDKNFLTVGQFLQFYQYNQNSSLPMNDIKVHFVECVPEDCGWGWISNNQKLNETEEQLFSQLSSDKNIIISVDINESIYTGNELLKKIGMKETYKVYAVSIPLNPGLVEKTREMQQFYFAPYMYQNMNDYIFNYNTSGLGSLFNSVGLLIIYLSMILVILTILIVFFLL